MNYHQSLISTVGRTPLIQLNRLTKDYPAKVLLKGEFFNPLGSVKDRIGLAMIQDAEARGLLTEGTTIIEPTSGNTGIALAFVAAAKGYPLILVMPESMSMERRILLSLLGARIMLTPAKDGMRGAIAKAEGWLEQIPRAWMPRQFENPANPEVHRRTTAHEIWQDTQGNIDIFVAAVGTGGTITGVGEVIKAMNPWAQVVAVEPEESPVISQTLRRESIKPGPHLIQGTGAGFVPKNLNLQVIDQVITISSQEAVDTAKRLAREEGILAGISTGANVAAALILAAKPENAGKQIVTIGCSTGERYLSTALAEEARSLIGQ